MTTQTKAQNQQGLQTTRPAQGQSGVQKAVPMTGTLTRLPERGSISTTDPNQATQWIEDAFEYGIPVVPFGNSVPLMPPGCGIMVTPVYITDFDKYGTQVYPIQGSPKMGIHKGPMDDIATGCGFDWPVPWTFVEPFPDGDERNNDPWCIKITVAGRYKDVDGSWKTLPPQTKEIDLREGSAEVRQIRTRHMDKQLSDLPPNATEQAIANRKALAQKKADAELDQNRKFIRSYAQTKARLMVIGTRMRRAYSLEELKKGPFYCFKVVQTWRSDNPATQERFDNAIIERERDSNRMLYGGAAPSVAAPPRALPPVSEDPYPEQQDAGVVSEFSDSAGETGAGQGEGAGAQTATVQGEQTQNQPQPRQCTPVRCFGADPAALHVNACYQPAGETGTAQDPEVVEEEQPWVLTQGPAKNLPVNDSRVRAETLIQMEHELGAALNPKGLVYGDLSDERKDLLSSELRKIGQELDRRKITEGRLVRQ